MIEIREVTEPKRRYLHLLLIGDESEEMIDRYLTRSHLFIAFNHEEAVGCCAITFDDESTVEIKNLAVLPTCRRKGIGRRLLRHVESLFRGFTFQLGTGETPSTLRFYSNCGYRYSHRIPNFFTDNYPQPIIEEGIRLTDMLYLTKTAELK